MVGIKLTSVNSEQHSRVGSFAGFAVLRLRHVPLQVVDIKLAIDRHEEVGELVDLLETETDSEMYGVLEQVALA